MFLINKVVFTTFSIEEPEASTKALREEKACLACSSTVFGISPVAGLTGITPEVNNISPNLVA